MIPFFSLHSFSLGPLTFQVWGLLAALGFLISLIIVWRQGQKKNLNQQLILNLVVWIIAAALVFSRLFYVLFGGELRNFLANPWLFFAFWQGGMAATGGFFGAALIIIWAWRRYKNQLWSYLEILAYGFPFGWLIGRLGCFLVHDHPGRLTNFFLAVNFPEGARFDMGLLEIMAILPLAVLFLYFSRRPRSPSFYSFWLLFWYGATRFFLDFLRAADLPNSDLRFFSLTLGQWGSLGLVLFGLALWQIKKRR